MDANHVLDRYVSTSQLVQLTGTDPRYVQRQTRRLGLRPALVLGERQWGRQDALKLILLARLQAVFGETSPLPFDIVAAAEPSLADLLRAPDHGTVMALRATGLNVVIGVPDLAQLVGRGVR